ncbi:MAG: polymerase [Pseudooceanicola sp.]|nr:polymerase [Pseudooceanicola sp.]
MFHIVEEFETISTSVELRRIDPSLNMRRFYRMSLQPDLFGGVDVVREWGRIGWRGQFLIERHSCEDEAVSSMLALETAKRRRGYRSAG